MMSVKSKNMSFNTSASRKTLVTIKILMVILQGLSSSVFATPLIWEPEWSAIVVPITQSPAAAQQGRLIAQTKDFQWRNHLATHSKSAEMVTEAPHLYSTCRGFSCHNMNRCKNHNVEDLHDKKNRHEKKRCGGKNQQNKPCRKDQHQKPCGKDQLEKRCGKSQGKKHCGEKRNSQSRYDTTNCNRQNKRKNNMQNGNKRRQFVVDNKVIINVNDGRTSGPTLLPWIETSVATTHVSIVPQCVGHRSFSTFYSFWYSDIIMWLSLLAIFIAIIFCIYKVYFISDRYHSIIY